MARTSALTGRKANEPWEQYCERMTLEAQDSIRVYRGMAAVIPLFNSISELKDTDLLFGVMAISPYDEAREALIDWVRRNCGSESVSPFLRTFDTFST